MKGFEYPETKEERLIEKIHGIEVEDDFRWLEELENERVKKWVKKQNDFTDHHIPKELIDNYKEELKEFLSYEREGPRKVFGNKEFYYHVAKEDNLFTIRVKDLETGKETKVVDPHEWSEDHTDSISIINPSPKGNYLIHDKVLGGDEWATSVYVLDMKTQQYIDEPIPNTRLTSIAWQGEEGFFYVCHPDKEEVSEERAYNERNVYYHKLGTDTSEDILIYQDTDPQVFTFIAPTLDNKDCMIFLMKGWVQCDVLLYQTENQTLITIIENIKAIFSGNIVEHHFIGWTNYEAPNGRIIKVDIDNPEESKWKTLVPEGKHSMDTLEFFGKRMMVRYLEESYHQVHVFDLEGNNLGKIKMPSIGSMLNFVGSWDSKEFQFLFTSFVYPYTSFKANIENLETEVVFQPKFKIELDEFETVLEWYKSKDGTSIPMFLTMKKGIKQDSNNPVLLHGYGGYSVSNIPYYYPRNIFLLKQGYILAYPSLRGGAEFGEKWHKAGMLENKQNVFDDFISAAEWLIDNNYTQTKLLTIEGGSNGGLLTGAVVVQRPELFGSVLILVPVLDMLRFHKFYNAKPWMMEYGDPDIEEEFKYLYEYSPYHKATQNAKYPSILLTTNINDKRVHPMHAFKMTAQLQKIEKENPVLLRTITKAGHGLVSKEQAIIQNAEICAFMKWRSQE